MTDSQVMLDMAAAMLRLVILASLPAVLAAAVIGLVVGIAQAVTQLQDQSLSFAIKFVGVAAAVALTLPWLGKALDHFMRQLFEAITRVP